MPDAVKVLVTQAAATLIESDLKGRHVKAPPADPQFNYVTGLSTRWHGSYFYFTAEYACPGPNAISPTFQENFARLEYSAGVYHLAFMRHTGQWQELLHAATLEQCLASIRDDPWFHP